MYGNQLIVKSTPLWLHGSSMFNHVVDQTVRNPQSEQSQCKRQNNMATKVER